MNFQKQMKMVGHQNVGIKIEGVTLTDNSQRFQKRFVVGLPKKDPLPVISTRYDMIEQSFCMNPRMAGHEPQISKVTRVRQVWH